MSKKFSIQGANLLHLASKFEQTKLVEWILKSDKGKSAKVQTYNGATCLHFAVAANATSSARLLLEAVPSLINMQMTNGVTPIYLGRVDILKL